MPRKYSELQMQGLAIATVPGTTYRERCEALGELQRGSDLPFAPESTAPFGPFPAEKALSASQRKIGKAIVAAYGKAGAGLSADECRAIFGSLLTGDARRRLFRHPSLQADGSIAPSYVAYRDGDLRNGSRHAREHGAEAIAKREADARKAEQAAARKAKREARKALRAAATAERDATAEAEASAARQYPVPDDAS